MRSSLTSLGFLEAHLLFVTLVSTLINSAIRYKNRTEHYTSAGKSSRMQSKVKEEWINITPVKDETER